MKQTIKRTLKRFGLEIRRTGFERDLMQFIAHRQIGTVIDVGANVGQFGLDLRSRGYRGRIISFEPIAAVFETLTTTTASDPQWEVHNCALGATNGEATIHVSQESVFSSILPTSQAAARYDDNAAVTRTETISVRRLDDACRDLSGNVLLKIDTQGFERQVLEGGRAVLPRLKGVLMELPIVHLYQGTWRFHEAVAFMDEAGFVPAQIHPVNYHSADPVSLVEVDCLFRPRDPLLD